MYKLLALSRIIKSVDPENEALIKRGMKAWGNALVNLEWPSKNQMGKYSEEDFKRLGWERASVKNSFEGWKRFDPKFQYKKEQKLDRKIYGLFRGVCSQIPFANCLGAFLSEDEELVSRVHPVLNEMLEKVDFDEINYAFVDILPVLYRLHLISLYSGKLDKDIK